MSSHHRYRKPATVDQRAYHRVYGEKVPPTPTLGGIVSVKCLVKTPPCPFARVVCSIEEDGGHREPEDPGVVRCIYYAPGESWTPQLFEREECYFYWWWRENDDVERKRKEYANGKQNERQLEAPDKRYEVQDVYLLCPEGT